MVGDGWLEEVCEDCVAMVYFFIFARRLKLLPSSAGMVDSNR